MPTGEISHPPSSPGKMPRSTFFIVGNEAAERFSYYGMRSILAGYIAGTVAKGGLGQDPDTATTVIHTFVFVNYFMPLFGAWLSDKIIGRYHTILWVSLFYCAGHGVLACSDFAADVHGKTLCLYSGLLLIAFGSGGIKPCVSAFMGDQFRPEQSHWLQKAYGAFYIAINFGSFFAFLVVPWVKDHHGYSPAFAVPGILMALATFVFWLGRKSYIRVPPSHQTRTAGFIPVFLSALTGRGRFAGGPIVYILTALGLPAIATIAMSILSFGGALTPGLRAVGWAGLVCVGLWYAAVVILGVTGRLELPGKFWEGARAKYSEREISGAQSVGPILFVFALVPVFWCLFDQTNSTWVLQGEKMVSATLFGLKIGAEEMQSANPALVLLLVPLLTLGVYPRIGRWASPLRRMSCGMFVAAGSYVVVALLQRQIEAGSQISVLWQIVPYTILTTAEVLISTTGLEFAFRESAPELKSTIMSFWLLTVALGNLIVTVITKLFSGAGTAGHAASVSTSRFLMYAGLTFTVAILFSVVSASYHYRDRSAAEGK
jgi:POT family proton-dependent oligopeptide transporter